MTAMGYLFLALALILNAGANVPKIKIALWDRGLYRTPLAPVAFNGAPTMDAANLGPASPLANDADQTITVTKAGATAIRVHF